jgi:hypothetical protein
MSYILVQARMALGGNGSEPKIFPTKLSLILGLTPQAILFCFGAKKNLSELARKFGEALVAVEAGCFPPSISRIALWSEKPNSPPGMARNFTGWAGGRTGPVLLAASRIPSQNSSSSRGRLVSKLGKFKDREASKTKSHPFFLPAFLQ